MATESPTGRSFVAVADIAERQHGVVAHRQLREIGVGERAIGRQCAAGLLHPVFRGVYAVGHRAIGELGLTMAAVLACGDGAVASHGTAAKLLGLRDRRPALVHVIAPSESGRGIDGIRWHRVPVPAPAEMTEVAGVPCTDPSRTIVDLAGWLGAWSMRRLIEQAAVLRLLDPPAIEAILSRRRRRGAPLLRSLLEPWRQVGARTPRLRSGLEARFLGELLERGLPRPLANQVLAPGGRRLEVDFLWPDRRVVVETDGAAFHESEPARARDRGRDRLLTAAGYRVIRVTWAELEEEPERIFLGLRRALSQPPRSGGS